VPYYLEVEFYVRHSCFVSRKSLLRIVLRPSLLSSVYRDYSLWSKRPEREAKHSFPSNTEVRNAWGSRGSSVNVVSGYEMDDRAIEVRSP
jgi:hemerythrin superfamily protein